MLKIYPESLQVKVRINEKYTYHTMNRKVSVVRISQETNNYINDALYIPGMLHSFQLAGCIVVLYSEAMYVPRTVSFHV